MEKTNVFPKKISLKWIDIVILLILICFYLVLRLPNISFPSIYNLDEYYYVPGAKSYFTQDKDPNPRHPPLAKIIIGTFIKLCGDTPTGWRTGPIVFGLLMIILIYFFGLALFNDRAGAVAAALLLNMDFLHIVQSRIATLDIFVAFFILLSFYFAFLFSREFIGSEDKKLLNKYSILCAVSLGLSVSCKLSGIFALVGVCFYLLVIFLIYDKKKTIKNVLWIGLLFGIVIPAIYFFMHIPLFIKGEKFDYLFYRDTFALHYTMNMEHPQLSSMLEWILVQKPIWYVWINDNKNFTITGITGMGSYVFWWGFLILFARLVYLSIKKREPEKILIVIAYLSLYLCWLSSFQIKNGQFSMKGGFSYYMLPCVPFMALTVADVINEIWKTRLGKINACIYFIVLGLYLYSYYPVLVGTTMHYYYFETLYFKGLTRKDPFLLIIISILVTLQLLIPTFLYKKNKKNLKNCV